MTNERLAETDRASVFRALAIGRLDAAYALAAHLLGEPAQAEETCRDALRRAWRAWAGSSDAARFAAWFDRILVERCTVQLRARARQARADGRAGPGDGDRIRAALAHLSVDERVVVVLRHAAALEPEAIAERTGHSAERVRSLLNQADRHLADRLGSSDADATPPDHPAADLEARLTAWFADHRQPWAPYGLRRALEDTISGGEPSQLNRGYRWRWPAVAAAVVLLAGAGFAAYRLAGGAATPSPSTAAVTSTSPTPSAATSARSTPSTPPLPSTLVALQGWSERVIDESAQGIQVIGWSPDGSWFAVLGGHDVTTTTLQVFDRSGTLVRTFPAVVATWIDAHDLLAVEGPFDAVPSGATWIRSVPTGDDHQVSVPTGWFPTLLPGGGWFSGIVGTGADATPAFRVVRDGQLSAPILGLPIALSPDGRRLTFLANQAHGPGFTIEEGPLHVLDLTTLRDDDLGLLASGLGGGMPGLNQDGSLAAACNAKAPAPVGQCQLSLIDTATGTVLDGVLFPAVGLGAWTGPDSLLLYDGQSVYQWSLGSPPVLAPWQPAGGSEVDAIVHAGYRTVVFVSDGPPTPASVRDAPGTAVISLGPFIGRQGGDLSPDGTRVVFARSTPGSQSTQLVLGQMPAITAPPPTPLPTPTPPPAAAVFDFAGVAGDGSLWAIQGRNWLTSTDAGATWQRHDLPEPVSQVLTVAALDPDHAWLVTIGAGSTSASGGPDDFLRYRVERTSDGGTNWRSDLITANYAGHAPKLVMLDAQHGYLLAAEERISDGISTVLRTSDGGTTWEATGSLPGLGSMFAASDSLTLWAGSQQVAGGAGHPLLDVSRDGGRTWAEAQLPGVAGQQGGVEFYLAQPPIFLSAQAGVVSVVSADQPSGSPVTRTFRTTDGGRTWNLAAELPVEGSAGPAVLDQNHWLLVTNPSGLLATDDAGKSWQPVADNLGPAAWFVWVGRATSQQLAALAPASNTYPGPVYLYISADGGQTWHPVG